jgi:hypothetical protein
MLKTHVYSEAYLTAIRFLASPVGYRLPVLMCPARYARGALLCRIHGYSYA